MKHWRPWSGSPTAAVMVVAAFLATACSTGQGVGSAPASASPAAESTTSAPATASDPIASPSPTPSPVLTSDGSLEAGTTYFINEQSRVLGPRWVVLTVPATGWSSTDNIVNKEQPGGSGLPLVKLSTWTVGNLKADPCRWKAGALDPPVGPTVGDLAASLIEQVGPTVATSTDVTLDGYRGKKIEYSAPADFDPTSCDEGVLSRWQPASSTDWGGWVAAGGQRNAVYIMDVDGQRLVIDTMSLPGASTADLAELDQMIASIRFEPRASSPSPSS
jgi:hypothetical protein